MAVSFNGTITLSVSATLTDDATLGNGTHTIQKTYKKVYSNGSGANQASQMYAAVRSINASSNEDLDLAGGLTNIFGDTITFATVKEIIIYSHATNGDNLNIGGDATAAFSTIFGDSSDILSIAPGGLLHLQNPNAAGYAVTGTSADILQIANADSAEAADYDIIIIGD